MTIEQMRKNIIQVYPGAQWKYKVERMSDNQIIRIHSRFASIGKFDEVAKRKRDIHVKQLSIFDKNYRAE